MSGHRNTFPLWCQWRSIWILFMQLYCYRRQQRLGNTASLDNINKIKHENQGEKCFHFSTSIQYSTKLYWVNNITHTHTRPHTNSVRQFMTMAFHMSMLLIVPLLLCINTDISQLADTPRIYMTLIKCIPTYVFSLHADTDTNHSRFLSNHITERHQQGLFNRSQVTARNMALCLDAVQRIERMNVVERYTMSMSTFVVQADVWVCLLMLKNTACILRLQ